MTATLKVYHENGNVETHVMDESAAREMQRTLWEESRIESTVFTAS